MAFFRFIPLLFASAALAWATSVRPPSFPELVDGSELVFRGQVVSVEAVWQGEGTSRHLATRVRYQIERVLKGTAGAELTLEFFGGHLGARQQSLAGLPQFTPGERSVCFVENREGRLCPIRRLRHGRYLIAQEAPRGTEYVLRDNGEPLTSTADVQVPLADDRSRALSLRTDAALTLAQFEDQILARAAAQASSVRP